MCARECVKGVGALHAQHARSAACSSIAHAPRKLHADSHPRSYYRWVVFGVATAGLWLLLGALWALRTWLLARCHYRLWRLARMLLVAGAISLLVSLVRVWCNPAETRRVQACLHPAASNSPEA